MSELDDLCEGGFPDEPSSDEPYEDPPSVPTPEYEAPAPTGEQMARLSKLAAEQGMLSLEIDELEEKLRIKKTLLERYQTELMPQLLDELGLESIRTRGGLDVSVSDVVRASFPQDGAKREAAFGYLRNSGNDGIVKREVVVSFGRDSTADAERLLDLVEQHGFAARASVRAEDTIHHQTLLAFIRGELRDGRPVPLEAFGAFVQRVAKVKAGRR